MIDRFKYEITGKYKTVLRSLEKERVFNMRVSQNKKQVDIFEGCDEFFCLTLSKDDMLTLIKEMGDIAEQME